MTDTIALEIRYHIYKDGAEFVVNETIGETTTEWRVPDKATANALVVERETMLAKAARDAVVALAAGG